MIKEKSNIHCCYCGSKHFVIDEERIVNESSPLFLQVNKNSPIPMTYMKCGKCGKGIIEGMDVDPQTIKFTFLVKKKKHVAFDMNKILLDGLRSPEVFELQRILFIFEDGVFGKHTHKKLWSETRKDEVSLNDLKLMGYKVKTKILTSKIWWINK